MPRGSLATRLSEHWRSNGSSILFRCWEERKVYDELTYQRMLAARRPKPPASAPVELQWKNVAGFSKIVIAGS